MTRTRSMFLALLAILLSPMAVNAEPIVIDFEGLLEGESVGEFYDGGLGGLGSGPGPSAGVTFSANAEVTSLAGSNVMFWLVGSSIVLNVSGGFESGLSLQYSSAFLGGTALIWDGPEGTGTLLATLPLDPTGSFTPLAFADITFTGTARSVVFGGTKNQLVFDNITLGAASVPEPGTLALLGIGLLGMALARRRKHPA